MWLEWEFLLKEGSSLWLIHWDGKEKALGWKHDSLLHLGLGDKGKRDLNL